MRRGSVVCYEVFHVIDRVICTVQTELPAVAVKRELLLVRP